MNWRSSLGCSILRYLVGFFMAQTALLAAVFAGYRIPWGQLWAPLAVSAACHAALAAFLLWRREDFRIEGTDTRLTRVNAPNVLTIGRISSIPTILFLVLLARDYAVLPIALPFICLVFASDFVDGLVARRGGGVTFAGRYLDSSSDYLLIIAVSILYRLEDLIPGWLFWLIMARLVLFAAGMALAALRQGAVKPVATFLGKASIFAMMVLYAMEAAERFSVPVAGDPRVVRIFEYLVAAIIVVSLADKAVFLRRLFSRSV